MLMSSLEIENFRGIKNLKIDLDKETVLIGENNTGKTTALHALRYVLEKVRSKKNFSFDEYDFHLNETENDPTASKEIKITIEFLEEKPDQWSDDIIRAIDGISSVDGSDRNRIKLQVRAWYDSGIGDFLQDWSFLNEKNVSMTGKAQLPSALSTFQQIRPVFYLSALRDAGKEFTRNSSFWGPFVKGIEITPELKNEIEQSLSDLNSKVVESHTSFELVKEHLNKIQNLISLGQGETVSIDAVPGRVFDLLSRTQLNVNSASGAKLPINRHGEGTQSLSVLLLFDAFLKAKLAKSYDKLAEPVIALEEPEAHLHPCAIRCLWKTIETLDGQKIVSTHSGDLISEVPISSIRRFYRHAGDVKIGYLKKDTLNAEELRKFNYHIRSSRGELLFANVWILVEGETEICLLKELSRILGHDIERWGIRCIEYAQSDIEAYLKVARDFGIEWCGIFESDDAGVKYRNKAKNYLNGKAELEKIIDLSQELVEQYLCENGFGHIYEPYLSDQLKPKVTVAKGHAEYWKQLAHAIKKSISKPAVALEVVKEIQANGKTLVPSKFKETIEAAIKLAGGTP